MANSYKHARGADQTVNAFVDEHLVLEIADNGPGFDNSDLRSDGLGLSGMRSRIEALGGTLSVLSGCGKGTKLTATFVIDKTSNWTVQDGKAL